MNMNEKNKIENCRIEPKLKLINMDSVEVEQVEWLLLSVYSLWKSDHYTGGSRRR